MGLDLDLIVKKDECEHCGRYEEIYLTEDFRFNDFHLFFEEVLGIDKDLCNCQYIEIPDDKVGELIKWFAEKLNGHGVIDRLKIYMCDVHSGENVKLFVYANW